MWAHRRRRTIVGSIHATTRWLAYFPIHKITELEALTWSIAVHSVKAETRVSAAVDEHCGVSRHMRGAPCRAHMTPHEQT